MVWLITPDFSRLGLGFVGGFTGANGYAVKRMTNLLRSALDRFSILCSLQQALALEIVWLLQYHGHGKQTFPSRTFGAVSWRSVFNISHQLANTTLQCVLVAVLSWRSEGLGQALWRHFLWGSCTLWDRLAWGRLSPAMSMHVCMLACLVETQLSLVRKIQQIAQLWSELALW